MALLLFRPSFHAFSLVSYAKTVQNMPKTALPCVLATFWAIDQQIPLRNAKVMDVFLLGIILIMYVKNVTKCKERESNRLKIPFCQALFEVQSDEKRMKMSPHCPGQYMNDQQIMGL